MQQKHVVRTIGYGARSLDEFLDLLRAFAIGAVCDVRSVPYSRRFPDYNRESLHAALRAADVRYVDLGREFGARPSDESLYDGNRASYERMSQSTEFRAGLMRLEQGVQKFSCALMCAEREPLDCHRAILIAPRLIAEGFEVQHIDAFGKAESHEDLERRLLRKFALHQVPLLDIVSDAAALAQAYERRGKEIAFDRTTSQANSA